MMSDQQEGPLRLETEGLEELHQRFHQFPGVFDKAMNKTMWASVNKAWELIPPYPEPPPDSTYKRTGTLGRTLGTDVSGSQLGNNPDIYEVKNLGSRYQGMIGTRLNYAPLAIGAGQQAKVHKNRWWTLDRSVVKSVAKPIEKLFKTMAQTLADWLDGRRQRI